MDWIKVLVALVVIGGWIISAIQEKGKAAKNNRPKPPPLPPADGEPAVPPRPVNDLQDFLNEVRRRKQAAEPPRREEEPTPAILVEERPRRAPKRAPRQRAEPRRAEPPPLMAMPVPEPPPLPSPPSLPPLPPLEAPRLRTEVPTLGVAAVVARAPAHPAVRDLLSLLKNRRSLATAVLLREVLDEPLCKRRRHAR